MDNFDSNVVNDTQTENVDGQQDTTVNEPVNAGSEEVATEQTDSKQTQTPEQNAEFARVRREAESRARTQALDEFIQKEGYEYDGRPITTYAEYERVQAEIEQENQRAQYQQQYGIDPKSVQPLIDKALENHPAVIAAKEQENVMIRNNAAIELSKVAQSLGISQEIKTWEDVEKLPKWESIKQGIMKNLDIVQAAKLAYFDDVITSTSTKVQQDTINKITANGQSSPGSLTGGAETQSKTVSQMTSEEFNKLLDRVKSGEKIRL
jgi:hypothetical protein